MNHCGTKKINLVEKQQILINTKNLKSFITVKIHCSVSHQKQQKLFLVLRWAVYVIEVIYYIHGPIVVAYKDLPGR